jgi:Zn-dependent protease with chaperone function
MTQPTKFASPQRAGARTSRWAIALILLIVAGLVATIWLFARTPFVLEMNDLGERVAATWRVGVATVGEDTSLEPNPANGPIEFCDGVTVVQQGAITDGVALLRATAEGARLYDVLVENGVCIGTRDLDFNSAYATSRWSPQDGWSNSEIVIGDYYVDWLYPEVIAAILAHEATHIDRAVSATACYYVDACTLLANGVALEEEIVAHEAEALWWIAAYGRDGKDRAFTADASENRLKAAYLRGPGPFREFVREMRSDEREGDGL